ncbi:MAG: hypothetical protein LC098_10650 [Burkholderiales bacterium]|uniref:hypothetical protein n=1 Tax=Dokdonella sp. TaxID=2291710 RepID=UPI0027B90AE0|nr:hypothetical protein [Dokdonella sp.]MCZ2135868.1 hypothetical protein [Burkholderiales bacterium]
MQPIDVESIRLEVARRHGVMLGKDDPILAFVTVNELVLEAFLARAREASDELERRGAALMAQEVAAVKATAEKMIGGAASFFTQEVRKAADAAETSVSSSIERRVAQAVAAADRAESVKRPAYVAAAAAIAAAFLTIGLAIGVLLK